MGDAVLGAHQLQLVAAAGLGLQQHFVHGGGAEFEGCAQVIAQQQACEEQPGSQVAHAYRLAREGQQRAAQVPGLVEGHQQHLEGIRRLAGVVQVLHQDRLRAAHEEATGHCRAVFQGGRLAVAEAVQLQLVRAQVVSHRGGLVEQELTDFRGDDAALLRMAHHRVAEVDRTRVCLADAAHHFEDRTALRRTAQVARQHRVAIAQLANGSDAVHQRRNLLRRQHLARPVAILGMVGELHGVQRPDVHPDASHGELRGAVAGVAEDDVGLDGENVGSARHNGVLLQNGAVWGAIHTL